MILIETKIDKIDLRDFHCEREYSLKIIARVIF
jgi:hypothetical protein